MLVKIKSFGSINVQLLVQVEGIFSLTEEKVLLLQNKDTLMRNCFRVTTTVQLY